MGDNQSSLQHHESEKKPGHHNDHSNPSSLHKQKTEEKLEYYDLPKAPPVKNTGGPRLLCLHGHNSNSDITRIQVMGLKLPRVARCEFLHAPHLGSPSLELEKFSEGPWYTWGAKLSSSSSSLENNWRRSLKYLAEFIKDNGPYDGVYAFSQGVALVTAFTNPTIWRDFGFVECPWKFVILACGGGSCLLPNNHNNSLLFNIPSFHINGKWDPSRSDSDKLKEYWKEGKRSSYTHNSGHEIDLQIVTREPDLGNLLHAFMANQKNKSV